ncbi:MAG: SMP-30/gluconolactonase/LRE family protein [Alphaproteobacteria bacterium]|nr:SMP-30/gluconolactonase/LRE family protein [Alphaproteobacteria bacterium]
MSYSFATSPEPVLGVDRAMVFFDGMFTEPKLSHPEGVAVGPDDWIWVGNQDGDICRVAPDGSAMERVASTGGFILGLAFDGDRALFACDLKHGAVFRLDLSSRDLTRFTAPGMKIPNYPLVDRARGRLFVSDSHEPRVPGPGIWSFDLATGAGDLWYPHGLNFANGLAMGPDGNTLYVCETFAPAITKIAINPDGSAGDATPFASNLPGLPDGIAFDGAGNIVVACYEPSRLLRISPDGGQVKVLIEDATAHVLCHPTNIAFADRRLFVANLGRWHVSEIAVDIGAPPLWQVSQ